VRVGNIAKGLTVGLAGLYALYAALAFGAQRRLIFAGYGTARPVADRPSDVDVWWFEHGDARVEAWFRPAQSDEPAPVVVMAHGNGELIDDWGIALRPLAEAGYAVLLVEFPGYGDSTGTPSAENISATYSAAIDRALERDDVEGLIGFGRSLGGGVIGQVSRERAFDAIHLRSTFTSLRPMVRPLGLPSALLRDPMDTQEALSSFSGPVHVMHGRADVIVPFEHGVALVDTIPNAELFAVDCGHNDCPLALTEVVDWLRANGL
jgi:pimeloyl-ACP methyl ester carboxylesterase